MPRKKHPYAGSKVKIGTILEKRVVSLLKERAVREGKAISALIEEAVLMHDSADTLDGKIRQSALDRLYSIRLTIPDDQWKTLMSDDYYDQ